MHHAIQSCPGKGEAVNVSIASQDANSWTITFWSATKGTATLVLNKGVFCLAAPSASRPRELPRSRRSRIKSRE